jgi:hypothetical protein
VRALLLLKAAWPNKPTVIELSKRSEILRRDRSPCVEGDVNWSAEAISDFTPADWESIINLHSI